MRHTSTSRKVFVVCNTIFLVTMALLCILPLWNLLAISFSGKSAANSGAVTFWPIDFTPLAYVKTFNNNNFIRSMIIAFLRTSFGTLLSMFVITTAGYALSKEFRGRTPLMWFFVFTMLFGGGLVPSYILYVQYLHIYNTIWVFLLPGLVSAYNVIILRTFIQTTIPDTLFEAAKIDGAGHWRIFFQIVLPLFKAGLATIALFNVVGRWNDWFTGLMYIQDANLVPIQTMLQKIQQQLDFLKNNAAVTGTPDGIQMMKQLPTQSLRMACVVIVVLPVLAAYPFFQRYFVQGLTMGSVKG